MRSRSSGGSSVRASAGARPRIARRWATPARASPSRAGSSATSSAGRRSSRGSRVGRISSADVARFRATFAPVLARELTVSPAPSWLPEGRGVALATSAPEAVFRLTTGRRTTIRTVEGTFVVEAHDDATALAALPADPCARRGRCVSSAPSAAPTRTRRGRSACRRPPRASSCASATGFPSSASSTLSAFTPFLSLHEGSWRRTESAFADSVRADP